MPVQVKLQLTVVLQLPTSMEYIASALISASSTSGPTNDAILQAHSTQVGYIHVHRRITSLPVEIILEIMDQLDWQSLLNTRQSCKHFNELSITLPVWRSQYRQYVTQKICPSRLEEPLDSYSAADLERWVLIRRSADLGWKRKDRRYTRMREIKHRNIRTTRLVPGGRWLLVAGREGGLLAFDLNASPISHTVLIPQDGNWQPVDMIAIDIRSDPGTQNLTFTMAVSPGCPSISNLPPVKINVWQVTLVGHGRQALLKSNPLCSFQADNRSFIEFIDIRANFFARAVWLNEYWRIQIFDWTKSTSLAHCKATIVREERLTGFRLLPGQRVLACSRQFLSVYTFTTIEGVEVATPIDVPRITQPVWKMPFDGEAVMNGGMSDGVSYEHATHFIISTNRQIYNLAIPHTDDAPRLSVLMDFDRPDILMMSLGFERAFSQHLGGQLTRLDCSWNRGVNFEVIPTNSTVCVFSEDKFATYNGPHPLELDEETGRVVQSSRNSIIIFDTAVLYDLGRFHVIDS